MRIQGAPQRLGLRPAIFSTITWSSRFVKLWCLLRGPMLSEPPEEGFWLHGGACPLQPGEP